MSEVSLSLGGKVKSILVSTSESVVSFECKIKQLFGIDSNTDIYGIRDEATAKIYSVEEVFSNPSIFSKSTGSIIPVALSPTSRKRRATNFEDLFKYIVSERSRNGVFKYIDYLILRVLFNKKASSMTSAYNLLIEGDFVSLNCHLHQIVSKAQSYTDIKMGVLQHVVLTMQGNKEILPEYASILLDLIKEEDGLVCEAYNQFEKTDDIKQLKDALFYILYFSVDPSRFPPTERDEVQSRKSLKRRSWRPSSRRHSAASLTAPTALTAPTSTTSSSSPSSSLARSPSLSDPLDITRILEELSRAELAIFTLYELNVLPEGLTMDILQVVSQDPVILHQFMQLFSTPGVALYDEQLYRGFMKDFVLPHHHHVNPLHLPLSTEQYPREGITATLLEFHTAGLLSSEEYVRLYRRCQKASPVLRHIYNTYLREHSNENCVNSLKTACTLFEQLAPPKATMSQAHALILQQLQERGMVGNEERQWAEREYSRGNDVIQKALILCEKNGDLEGLSEVIHRMIEMINEYEQEVQARTFLELFINNLWKEGKLTDQQEEVLRRLLEQPASVLLGVYEKYTQTGNLEQLINTLIALSNNNNDNRNNSNNNDTINNDDEGLQNDDEGIAEKRKRLSGEEQVNRDFSPRPSPSALFPFLSPSSSSSAFATTLSPVLSLSAMSEEGAGEWIDEHGHEDDEDDEDDEDEYEDDGNGLPTRQEVEQIIESVSMDLTEDERKVCLSLIEEGNVDIICLVMDFTAMKDKPIFISKLKQLVMSTTSRIQAAAILTNPPSGVEIPSELCLILEKNLGDPKTVEAVLVFAKTGEMEVFAPWRPNDGEAK